MADKHASKKTDLPPKGDRNPDPITDEAGAHPIETGIGAALGGAAVGAAVGTVAGPVGTAVGAAIGAVAGGYAGKGVGEYIDPTIEDQWLREYVDTREKVKKGESHETFRPAYRYGIEHAARYEDRRFEDVEPELRSGWESYRGDSTLGWERARDAARDAWDRTLQLREERLKVGKKAVETGRVDVRKEVVTEHKNISVPVEREEVVIERRPARGKAVAGDMRAEEIRIPTKEEKVHVRKETVAKEEVKVGKRKVQGTETVSEDVAHEELTVETEGKARARNTGKSS